MEPLSRTREHAAETLQILLTFAALRASGVAPPPEDGYVSEDPFAEAQELLREHDTSFNISFDTGTHVELHADNLCVVVGDRPFVAVQGKAHEPHVLHVDSRTQQALFAVHLGQYAVRLL